MPSGMERGNWTTIASGYDPPGAAGATAVVSACSPGAVAVAAGSAEAVSAAAAGASGSSSAGAISASTFACHSSQSGSGLSEGSCHTSLIASSRPLWRAWTHTPSTVGENQRGRTTTCPTSGT